MIPRVYYSLLALCLAVFVSAVPQEGTASGEDVVPETFDPDAEQFIDFDETLEYVEYEDDAALGRRSPGKKQKACKKLAVRREWRDLTSNNKKSYIAAVKCLMSTPSTNSSLPANFNKYDEYVYSHSNVAEKVHGVAQFLPWHRHFGHVYEQGLRTCGYKGPFPYWDWTRDTLFGRKLSQSSIFDPKTGFGGNGVIGTYTQPTDDDGSAFPLWPNQMQGCLMEGPFANTTMHVGPGLRLTDHCLGRTFVDDLSSVATLSSVIKLMAQPNYDKFWNEMDGMPFKSEPKLHDMGHGFMGGSMASFYTSPNEPIFYLHHANLDRLWWQWQKWNLFGRLYQVGGKAQWFEPYGQITLDYMLPYAGFTPDVRLRDAMDPRMEPYCYTYL